MRLSCLYHHLLGVVGGMCVAGAAVAAPISISAMLTGDTRPENPDNLKVNVTITGDTTLGYVDFLVDLDMALTHPNVKLDAFFFNVVGGFSDYTFTNWNPNGWFITSGTNAQGSGGMDFLFEADNCSGQGCTDVTNAQSLSFRMNKVSGLFSESDFLNAEVEVGDPGSGQLGAHLQSLTQGTGNNTDSGFALGRYGSDTSDPGVVIPEPASLALVGLALAGAGIASRRRRSA